MTYRHPLAHRLMFPILITPFVAVVWWSLLFTGFKRFRYDPVSFVGATALIMVIALAIGSWRVWTTRVTLTDKWIEWIRGGKYQSLGWDQISKLGYRHFLGGLKVGLVDRDSGLLHPLPLMPVSLYKMLSERFGNLPQDIEAELLH